MLAQKSVQLNPSDMTLLRCSSGSHNLGWVISEVLPRS